MVNVIDDGRPKTTTAAARPIANAIRCAPSRRKSMTPAMSPAPKEPNLDGESKAEEAAAAPVSSLTSSLADAICDGLKRRAEFGPAPYIYSVEGNGP